jgi:signal transduction histidine kinase
MSTEALTLTLSGGYGLADTEELAAELEPLRLIADPVRLELDLGAITTLSPSATVQVGAGVQRLSRARLLLPGSSCLGPNVSYDRWLQNIDLPALLMEPAPSPTTRACGCAPFEDRGSRYFVQHGLMASVSRELLQPEGGGSSMRYILGDLIDNVLDHSGQDRGGVAAVRAYGARLIELAVADAGVGIRASLGRNPEYDDLSSDAVAIRRALDAHVTSKPGGGGIGLFLTRRLMELNGGALVVRSGTAEVVAGSVKRTTEGLLPFAGTLVALRVRTDRPLNMRQLHRRLMNPAGI